MGQLFTHSPFAQPGATPPPPGQEAGGVPAVPPPPAMESVDVTIRTMASDLELMGKSGGSVRFGGPQETLSYAQAPPRTFHLPKPSSVTIVWIIVGLIGTGILFFAGYFFLPLVLEQNAPPRPAATPPPAGSLPSSTPAGILGTHVSYFNKPPDAKLNVVLSVLSGAAPQAYANQIRAELGDEPANLALFELNLRDLDGAPVPWSRFLEVIDFSAIPADTWNSRFESDFTPFIYRDAKGLWPGFVLKLKSGQSPLVVKSTFKLEDQSASLSKFFLDSPGRPAESFRDLLIGNFAVRSLNFEKQGMTFTYGWPFDQYLILSTSEDGFRQVLQRL